MDIISDISLQEFRQKYVLEGFDYPLQELFEDAKEFHFSGKNAKKGVLTQVFKKLTKTDKNLSSPFAD